MIAFWGFCLSLSGSLLTLCPPLLPFCAFPGLHADNVLPAGLARQATVLLRDPAQPDLRQQGGWPALGPRHVLPQWQEIIRPWCHGEKQNDPTAPGRHRSVWSKVRSDPLWQQNKTKGDKWHIKIKAQRTLKGIKKKQKNSATNVAMRQRLQH